MVCRSTSITLYDGTTKRIYARADTKEEADRILQDKIEKFNRDRIVVGRKVSFRAWAEEWQKVYCKPTVSAQDYKQYDSILRYYFLPCLGDIALLDLRPFVIQSCINEMQGKSKSHISKARSLLTNLLKMARLNGLIASDDILYGLKWPEGTQGERRALTPEERDIFMRCFPKHEKGLLFALMYGCGLRPGEASALMWSDVLTDRINVRQAVKASGEIGVPKTRSGLRTVPLPLWLRELLAAAPRDALYVVADTKGRALSKGRVKMAWSSLKSLAYIEAGCRTYRNQILEEDKRACSLHEVTPYYLRHTYATILAENDIPLKTAQYLMGHSDIRMTAEIYTHVTDRMVDAACRSVSTLDFNQGEGCRKTDKLALL